MRAYSPTLRKEIDIPDEVYQQSLARRQQATAPTNTSMMGSYMPTQQPTQQPATRQLDYNKVMSLMTNPNTPSKVRTMIEKAWSIQQEQEKAMQEQTAETQKQATKTAGYSSLGANIQTLEQQRQQIKNRGPLKGRIPALGGAVEPEIGGFDTAKNITAYNMAEILAGQTGRSISDNDRKVFYNSLPKRTDTDQVAQDKMQTAIELLGTRMLSEGATPEQVAQVKASLQSAIPKPQVQQQQQGGGTSLGKLITGAGKGVFNFMLGGARNTFQDVTAAQTARATNPIQQQNISKGEQLAQAAAREKDPQRKQAMLAQAQQIFSGVGGQQKELTGKFSKDVNVNPLLRGLTTGIEVAGAADLATGLKGVKQLFNKPGEMAGKVFGKKGGLKAAGLAQEQAAKAAGEVSKESIIKALGTSTKPNMKLLEGVGTAAEKSKLTGLLKSEIQDLIRPLGKNPTVLELLKKRQGLETATKWAEGTVQTSTNKLYKNIYRAFNQVLDDYPEVRKIDRLLQELAKSEAKKAKILGVIKSTGGKALIGGAVGAPISYGIYKGLNKIGDSMGD